MNKLIVSSAALLVLLAGCTAEPASNTLIANETASPAAPAKPAIAPAKPDAAEAAGPALNLAPDELTLVLPNGAARHVPFGMEKAAATQMITAALGSPIEQATNPECGAGALDSATFRDGLSLYFQGGKFVGWDLDGRENGKFATANGIGLGATRAELQAAAPVTITETSIGQEFRIGEMSGLLSSATAEAKVTNLWAGVTCIAR